MQDGLYQDIIDFMKKEKLTLNLSKISDREFWLDGPEKKITVKILVDTKAHEVLYDVYSVIEHIHIKEEKVKDVEQNEFIEEDYRRWKIAELLEEIWLVIDNISLWCQKNKYLLKETELL
jgi:hypothetical protein